MSHAASIPTTAFDGAGRLVRALQIPSPNFDARPAGSPINLLVVHSISLPGRAKQRGRSTSFGKWMLKGNDVLVTYSKITDRLRYSDYESLSAIGQTGAAAALKPVGKPDRNSKIGGAILWKAPHEYRLKAPAASPQAPEPAGSPTTNQ